MGFEKFNLKKAISEEKNLLKESYTNVAIGIYEKYITVCVLLANHINDNDLISSIGTAIGAAVVSDIPIIVLMDKYNPCAIPAMLSKIAVAIIPVDLNDKQSVNDSIRKAVCEKIDQPIKIKVSNLKGIASNLNFLN